MSTNATDRRPMTLTLSSHSQKGIGSTGTPGTTGWVVATFGGGGLLKGFLHPYNSVIGGSSDKSRLQSTICTAQATTSAE
jgi:hypothetical protein